MAAAAFKIALSVVNSKGDRKSIPMTVSDVNGAYALFPSGANELPLSQLPSVITDVTYTAAGTDTSQLQVWINGFNTGYVIYNALNLGTNPNRQVQQTPIQVPANASLKLIQVT